MKTKILIIVLLISFKINAQELFVVTEPASNMPSGSLGIRIGQSAFKEKFEDGYNYHAMPELMWGVNKNFMIHATTFLSNRSNKLVDEGYSVYTKWRFYSADDFHSHFRLAAYARVSNNNSDIHQEQIEIMGHNSGYETGIIATQLINKVAISSSISFEKALDNSSNNKYPTTQGNTATNYSLSFGKLMLPKVYTNFKQTNMNLMLEFLGQTINSNGKSYIDIVPSIQFIFNSRSRLDIAYRRELMSSMFRTAPNGIYLNFEYTLFNVFK